MTLTKTLLAVALTGLSLLATADDATIRKNLGERIPQLLKIDEITKSAMPGLFEIRVNGTEIFYTDAEGNYLIQGSLIDTRQRRNLTEERVDKLTAIAFESLPVKDAFTIVRGNGKRKLAVFEDPNCGYCKKFERDLQKIDNVTISMFLYPILSSDSADKSRNIWCAKDKGKAWQDWMVRDQTAPAAPAGCDTAAIARNVELGRKYKITGTPTLIFADGSRVPGAIGAAQVEKYLTDIKKLMATAANTVLFRVEAADTKAHLYHVTLTISLPAAVQRLSLPVWIPGSYLVREFSKNLQRFSARQGKQPADVIQLDKCTWQVDCDPRKPLTVTYEIYALDNSVRTAWLDASRGFFNGTSLFVRVEGQTEAPHELTLVASPALKTWEVATSLSPVKVSSNGFGTYRAANYDELVDCPVEMGNFWSGTFSACGVPHRFVVAGAAPSFDGAKLLADTQKICETEIRFWHQTKVGSRAVLKPPHNNYLFMLNVVDDGYGGLEHRNSTALICNRKDLPRLGTAAKEVVKQPEGYTTLLGLISHEYFHTWNVKRLRPAEFATYDYSAENYTALLWFFEGFTSYYDDLLLRRAGLLDDAGYLKLLNKTINQVMQTPGRLVQSVAQSSFDAWVKYYRQDENTPNATVSYYTKGALVALCLDLTLRAEGKTSLDAVMRALWQRCKAGPMTEDDLAAVVLDLAGRSFAPELAAWVYGTDDLPLKGLLQAAGVAVSEDPAQWAQVLGLRVVENHAVQVKTVLRGGAAEQAGFTAGDEWLGLEVEVGVGKGKTATAWRISKLDEVVFYAGAASRVIAVVARDKRLLKLPLTLAPRHHHLAPGPVREPQQVAHWLAG